MNTFKTLPTEWREWINQNQARGCDTTSMIETMVKEGGFTLAVATAAVMHNVQTNDGIIKPLPYIKTQENCLQLPDCKVNILVNLDLPKIVLVANFMSDNECDELVAYAKNRLAPSLVVSTMEGVETKHQHRSSLGAMFQRGESQLISRIEARLEALTHWPIENGEGLQVLHYEMGGEYRPHFDWFNPDQSGPRKHLAQGGQRLASIVMYLSDVEEGGGTSFPAVGFQAHPKKGSALFFLNTDSRGTPDKLSLHAGMPVLKGVKIIMTKWLRENKY